MRDVALLNGGPFTRIGGWPASTSKKLFAAAIVEAADSDVAASFCTPAVRAAWKFAAVFVGKAPIVNSPGPGGELVVAGSVSCWLVPSGRLKPKVMASPGLGVAGKSRVIPGVEAVGPLTSAPFSAGAVATVIPKTVA